MEAEQKKYRQCVVVSDGMDKSRVGRFSRVVRHSTAEKYIKRTTKIMFHDEKNETRVGDEVLITECAPLSARKTFTLVSVVKKHEE